ncbi:hypothetical protein TSYNTROOL_19850 [Tepidanaerobacter syntrophicus]|uniref:hypothetical protein n=1 Tax=Tepidanaerobacter syntrophicus TaxID=224999 RepID=UPI0022EF7C08|nr:hypothetical protein [Tepidanaerobacter syntrophicus]GLI51899.1 hypothetical protein TSYNTROOL_19850 [Tepidanaerobacter syntrophicus]
MDFTYDSYLKLLGLLKEKGYHFCDYLTCDTCEKPVIIRHDIDSSLDKAIEIARLENSKKISSTFFVLLATDFYNIFSRKSYEAITEIMALGHQIGLHFDEKRYNISNEEELKFWVQRESEVVSYALNKEVKVVSMHRPSRVILENDIQFDGIINSYSKKFLFDFKYLSDSRMHWREDVIDAVKSNKFNKLHILTHPFWYSETKQAMQEKLYHFIGEANKERYFNLRENITNFHEIINEGELFHGN